MKRIVIRRLTVLAVTMLAMLAFASPAWAETFEVDRNDDPDLTGSTIADDCTAAPNNCSLRGAIEGRSATNGQTDTIVFDFVTLGTINLGGPLTVWKDTTANHGLTINGPGQSSINVRGNGTLRVFQIVGKTTINDITISGGRSPNSAGSILNNSGAKLTLNDTTVTDNQALGTQASTGLGGGIFNVSGATLTLNRSTFSNNKANTPTGYGGGIYNQTGATATLNDSTVNGANTSSTYGGGLYNGGTLTLNDSSVDGVNTASHGGGIFNGFGKLTLNNSTVSGNEASSYGGGLFNDGGTLTLDNSTVSANEAAHGGGLYNAAGGTLSLNDSTVTANQATHGGGISSNTDLAGKTTTVTNSTISGNTASIHGGGIRNSGGRTVIKHSTITNNTATLFGDGSGVASFGNALTRTEVLSSIVSANTNTDVDFVDGADNTFMSKGFNLIGDGTATAAFNKLGDRPLVMVPGLGPLANNGGPTQTHAVLKGSRAVDRGAVNGCPKTDQRGIRRPQNGDGKGTSRCDVGAYEKKTVR